MKILTLITVLISALIPLSAQAQTVQETDKIPPIPIEKGMILKELIGRTSKAQSTRCSVAFLHLEPGKATEWSYNLVAEESFLILKGHGDVWTGNTKQKFGPGSFILIPANVVRSVRADQGEAVEFYAVTAPAWSPDDDKEGKAPTGFTK